MGNYHGDPESYEKAADYDVPDGQADGGTCLAATTSSAPANDKMTRIWCINDSPQTMFLRKYTSTVTCGQSLAQANVVYEGFAVTAS